MDDGTEYPAFAILITAEMLEEIRERMTVEPFSRIEAYQGILKLQAGWHWVLTGSAGPRLIFALSPWADPSWKTVIPGHDDFRHLILGEPSSHA
jgi:hypothetical protein